VAGFTIGNEKYVLKQVRNNSITIEKGNSILEQLLTRNKYFFMQQLTMENSRIHLYKNDNISINKDNNREHRMITYYLQLPNDNSNEVHNIEGSKLLPQFEVKMSALVNDCSILAQKITERKPGYYYSDFNLPILSIESNSTSYIKDLRVDVLMTIINKYNQCK
jgi:hypothetical protein